jgi:hypothetical protein
MISDFRQKGAPMISDKKERTALPVEPAPLYTLPTPLRRARRALSLCLFMRLNPFSARDRRLLRFLES